MNFFKKNSYLFFFALLFFTGSSFKLHASEGGNDSLTIAAKKRANKAALMSAILPGLGQIYNEKYWKLPILYGGATALIYFISENNKEYKKFKQAIILRNDDDSTTTDDFPRFTNEDLSVRKNYYRRNRDLSYIFTGLLYTLNILDAYVDSQLMNFDISDDLSLHSGGKINYTHDGLAVFSFQIVIHFK